MKSFTFRNSKRFTALDKICASALIDIKAAGTFKTEREIASPQGVTITVNNRTLLNFCSNNYLGLANNDKLKQSCLTALDTWGFGVGGARPYSGTHVYHKQLESKVAQFFSKQDCLLNTSCFDSNGGFFNSLLDEKDAIISDSLNHASIIDGIRLSKAKRFRYQHNDMHELEESLKSSQNCRVRLIVTDGVFSMDGEIAKLDKIVNLADKYDADLFVDDCHGSGVLGKTGRGVGELFGLMDKITVLTTTLGKALGGGAGGVTVSSKEIIELLRQRNGPYLESNSMSPVSTVASIKAIELLEENSNLIERLRRNTHSFRDKIAKAGFEIKGDYDCPIVPVMIRNEAKATALGNAMSDNGIYVVGFCYPVVPKGEARIRVQLSAEHEEEHIEKAVECFKKQGKELGII